MILARFSRIARGIAAALVVTHTSRPCGAADLPVVAWQGRTMGSDYTVKIVDGKLTEQQVTALKTEIEKTLVEVNRQMSNYQPDSELSRFNRAPEKTPFKISADFSRVTRFALELSRQSDGAFDPTLGSLINLWGFGEKTGEKTVPDAATLSGAMAKIGWKHLTIGENGELTKDIPGLAMDLGAVAKGFGVDRMIEVLRTHGLENLYASIAGEVRVLGHNPRGTKWMLGVTVPVDHWRENNPMATMLSISNQALSTSGDYQKFFVDASGRRLCHIIDARTGIPVQHNLASVTIVGPDSMTADGLSTSVFVLGPEAGMKWIESREDAAALFILREKDGSFRQVASSKFEKLTGYRPPP
ncbi:MAG: FAD:protein FMN transferase [Verrucomicrobiota bacterium]